MRSLPHVRSNSPILDSHMSAPRERDNACWRQSTAITNKELPLLTLYRLKAVCLLIVSIEYALRVQKHIVAMWLNAKNRMIFNRNETGNTINKSNKKEHYNQRARAKGRRTGANTVCACYFRRFMFCRTKIQKVERSSVL
ncbi:hypothetical protein AVEN_170771-1 [Araneus ventricosus]|uniref:Uncharacterized protein n=1 Tax=Araneus ventricosus TaxID=182803 RepID=A0A4Y2F583_ARAVE|nr:hypothetical protein AVEN_170771-1 [Araneus ventricosus]